MGTMEESRGERGNSEIASLHAKSSKRPPIESRTQSLNEESGAQKEETSPGSQKNLVASFLPNDQDI